MSQPNQCQSESRMARQRFSICPLAVFVVNAEGGIISLHQPIVDWFGYHPAEIVGQKLSFLFPDLVFHDVIAQLKGDSSHSETSGHCRNLQRARDENGAEILVLLDLTVMKLPESTPIDPLYWGVANVARKIDESLDRVRQVFALDRGQEGLESCNIELIAHTLELLMRHGRNALQRAAACLDLLELDFKGDRGQTELSEKIRRSLADMLALYEAIGLAQPFQHTTSHAPLCSSCHSDSSAHPDSNETMVPGRKHPHSGKG